MLLREGRPKSKRSEETDWEKKSILVYLLFSLRLFNKTELCVLSFLCGHNLLISLKLLPIKGVHGVKNIFPQYL